MSSSRGTVIVLILIGVVSALAGVFGNVAASALPDGWQPYLWLAWPLFILFTAAGIGLAIWQTRRDPPAPPQPAANPSPPPATQSPNRPVTQSTNLPVHQSTPDPSFAYDVFISYSSADKAWVRGELLAALEGAGLRVCIDYRDFQPGAPSVTEMERAILTSQRTLLVLTPAYLRSAWTEFEALMLQTLDAANRQRRLIPLLLQRCDLPLRIRYLTYVNFVDPDDPAWAWTQLLTALGAPPAPQAEQPATPEAWLLAHPYGTPPNFTGRRAERALLSDWLERDSAHPLLVICALGGFGKAPVIELYHHTLAAGRYDEVWVLFRDRLWKTIYYQLGAYQTQIELLRALFPEDESKPPVLTNEAHQAHAMNELANSYSLSGQPRRAVPLYEASNAIHEKRGNKKNLAIGLGAVASGAYMPIGALRAAEANLHRRIELCREIGDEDNEAVGHQELGRLLAYRSAWVEAEGELALSSRSCERTNDVQGLCIDEAYRTLRALLLVRATPPAPDQRAAALHATRRSLELADETARTLYPYARDYLRAHWLLGAAYRASGDHDDADRHLSEALIRCRSINNVDLEAYILLDVARLRRDASQTLGVSETPRVSRDDEALRLAQETLAITERSGYVLQGADVQLLLAQLALDAGDRAAALEHARQARQLATCDGPPDYTYKVAHDEAGALVERLEDGAG